MSDEKQNASYQLLFGFLALQNDFITREQLIAGFTHWVADKSKPIDSHLCKSGSLPEDERMLVAGLVKKYIEKQEGNPEKSLLQLNAGISPLISSLNANDDRATETLVQLFETEFQSNSQVWIQSKVATVRSNDSRYRVVSSHAKGGLGEVFKAIDGELQREVALKEIQTRYADDLGSRARFVLEAEITGSLEHPGIVPVYGLGHYENGRPYYAMRFIHGWSLMQLVDQYFEKFEHAAEAPNVHHLEWRQLIGHFVSVCKAIEYAHSRGVIHRDIKPSNIMAGRFGETLVVDWGLAKVRGRQESACENGETTLKPSSGEGSNETRAGSAIGTPAFMSPEQALGKLDETGPASDIYSLGATLYYVLTGQAPFANQDIAINSNGVSRGDVVSPRKIRPAIARSLEAICDKAMATDQKARYESARALSDDLELWLADEPVTAFRGTLSERTGRWMRRNRSLVQSSVIGLVLLTLFSSASAYVFLDLKSEADNARLNSEIARVEAEKFAAENEQLAKEETAAREKAQYLAQENSALAIKNAEERELAMALAKERKIESDKSRRLSDFLIRTFQAADPIGQGAAPGFLPKERGGELTAHEMLGFGAKRITTDKDLIEHPLSQAAVMDAIGDAYRQLGIFQQAEPLLTEALRIRRSLLPENHIDISSSLHNLAWYYHERGNYPQAEPLYAEALAIRKQLDGSEGRRLEANTLHNMAWMLANEGRGREAETLIVEALAIRNKTLGAKHRDTLFSQFALCFVLIEQKEFFNAGLQIAIVRSNLSFFKAEPKVSDAVFQFALGVINRNLVGLASSEQNLRAALNSGIEGLGKDNIYVAVIRCELGVTLEAQGKFKEALEQYELSLAIGRSQVALEHPRVRILVNHYADLLRRQGRAEEGASIWKEFLTAQRRRFDPRYGQVLDAAYSQAVFLRETENYSAAIEVLEDLANTVRSSRDEQSGYRYKQGLLGNTLNQQGLCYLNQTQALDRAKELFNESIAAFRADDEIDPKNLPTAIGWAQVNLLSARTKLGEFEAAKAVLSDSQRNIELVRSSDRKEIEIYHYQTAFALFVASEDYQEALDTSAKLRSLIKKDSAKLVSLCKSLCRLISRLDADSDSHTLAINHAIATLVLAIDAGYEIEKISDSTDLKVLQTDPRYQELLEK